MHQARQHQTHLANERRTELLERYRSGERAFELAKAFNLNRRTVADIVSRAGIRRSWKMEDEHVHQAVTLYGQGLSCARIGEELGRDAETVRQALKRTGVQLRPRPGR